MTNEQHIRPIWASEAIIIEEYNSGWPLMAVELIKELKDLYNFNSRCFEHIGSTAVPNLAAKPVIDIISSINDFDDLNKIITALSTKKWNLIPADPDDKNLRRTFVKVVNNKRVAHFHLVLNNSDELKIHLTFRDVLRQYPLLANDYAKLKIHLAEVYKNDREGYTNAKSDFIKSVLNKYTSR